MTRLFWKILLSFWVTFAGSTLALVLLFVMQDQNGRAQHQVLDPLRVERLTAARAAFAAGGRAALEEVAQSWPADFRAGLVVPPKGADVTEIKLTVPSYRWSKQLPGLAAYLIGGLIFSVLLAYYLTRPIEHLRRGFSQVARGGFDVRLTPLMKRRRDEVADLARDFDHMAEQLEQLIAARDRLMHDVSHELRSPLARLDLAVALARLEHDQSSGVFDRIEAESARINALVGDLLSLSRAEDDPRADPSSYFELSALLELICQDAAFEAQTNDVHVELAIEQGLTDRGQASIIAGAPELLRRAVENVVRNAIRFSPTGGFVWVSARKDARDIIIDIRDEGPGVPADMLERMFDPFVKGAGEARGVGLGLSIARRAIATYQGEVTARNLAGGGLLIQLRFPRRTSFRAYSPLQTGRPSREAPLEFGFESSLCGGEMTTGPSE